MRWRVGGGKSEALKPQTSVWDFPFFSFFFPSCTFQAGWQQRSMSDHCKVPQWLPDFKWCESHGLALCASVSQRKKKEEEKNHLLPRLTVNQTVGCRTEPIHKDVLVHHSLPLFPPPPVFPSPVSDKWILPRPSSLPSALPTFSSASIKLWSAPITGKSPPPSAAWVMRRRWRSSLSALMAEWMFLGQGVACTSHYTTYTDTQNRMVCRGREGV